MLSVKEKMSTKTLTKISILSAIAAVIMLIELPIWFAPGFLKIDASDLPALIGSFSLGPVAGVIIELFKNILKILMKGSDTAYVGELANFIVGSLFVYGAGLIYNRKKNRKNAVLGMIVGTLLMTITMSFANYYVLLPFYSELYKLPLDNIIEMAKSANGLVVDLKTFILYTIVPFNLLKGIGISAITLFLYKRISPILHK